MRECSSVRPGVARKVSRRAEEVEEDRTCSQKRLLVLLPIEISHLELKAARIDQYFERAQEKRTMNELKFSTRFFFSSRRLRSYHQHCK